ncbi:MAG: hypothetical protein AVDCRST_MAG48-2277, partial [uncultured Friedmanniella sp.]
GRASAPTSGPPGRRRRCRRAPSLALDHRRRAGRVRARPGDGRLQHADGQRPGPPHRSRRRAPAPGRPGGHPQPERRPVAARDLPLRRRRRRAPPAGDRHRARRPAGRGAGRGRRGRRPRRPAGPPE